MKWNKAALGLYLKAFQLHWRIYLIESWSLGMFMVSASFFVILIEHPDSPIRQGIPDATLRRILVGLAMGITAVLLIYSKWGKRSGAHMNPAVTLTFLTQNRICKEDAFWYIIFQFIGAILGVEIYQLFLYKYISDPGVNYVVTIPGPMGIWVALVMEFLLSFIIILTVLLSSNSKKMAPYTGYFVGILLILYITFEAPLSGMSINPARTLGSALVANEWQGLWLYFVGPIAGMLVGGYVYRYWYYRKNNGDCSSMKFHLSGNNHNCPTYEVLEPEELVQKRN
jgi:aquaporin Z